MLNNEIKAKLLFHSPVYLVAYAMRKCTGTIHLMDTDFDAKSFGPKDKKILSEKCLKLEKDPDPKDLPHESILEHLTYTFELHLTRGILQQSSRHRVGFSPSVESTRFALKRILSGVDPNDPEELMNFILKTGDKELDLSSARSVGSAIRAKARGVSNDKAKSVLPDSFLTSMVLTCNARSLRHWFALRTNRGALEETRDLAYKMALCIPNEHFFMFKNVISLQNSCFCR